MNILSRFALILLSSVAVFSFAQAATVVDPHLQLVAAAALHDGVFVGGNYDAYYGTVQVQATVQGGQVVGVKTVRFPNHSGESRSINRQALPMLLQEVVAAQSSRIDMISGATLTSRAYIASLRDALKQSSN